MMISAVVLAAGLSRRMGSPKMTLPWGAGTVIGRVVEVLQAADPGEILVVSGGAHSEVTKVLMETNARVIYNPNHSKSEMLGSLQLGLRECSLNSEAALITLGDQPQIQLGTVVQILEAFRKSQPNLLIPSYQMRRGHPWLVARPLWQKILQIPSSGTLRDFLGQFEDQIEYVTAANDTILRDIDTQEDYARERPSN